MLTTALVLLLGGAPSPSAVAAATAPPAGTDLSGLPSLWDERSVESRNEPDFCPTSEVREVNPNVVNTRSLEAGPPKFLVEDLEPGTTYRHCFYVLNRKPEVRRFEFETLDVSGSLDPTITLETEPDPVGVGAWFDLPYTRVTLQPGERIVVPYELRVPQTPPAGTTMGGIRIVDVTSEATAGKTAVRSGLVLQLQATFPGGIRVELDVSRIQAPRLIWRGRELPRYVVNYQVANKGTVIDSMTPSLRIEGLLGRTVGQKKELPDVIAPGSARRATLRVDDLPWIGRYSPKLIIKSSGGTRTIELPTLWIVPPWPYLAALVVALAVLAGAWWRRRRAWRHYLDDADDDAVDEFDMDDHDLGVDDNGTQVP